MIGKRVSHYRILEHLGEGGFGNVYKAKDESIPGRMVAIKFLKLGKGAQDKERKRRFLIEAQAAAALDHPNIADIIEYGETDGLLFISMKFYEGDTLHDHMEKQGYLSTSEALFYAIQIASGLEHAHQKRILNRDLKPGNIILTRKDGLRIIDFGLAKLMDTPHSMTTQGPMGTVPYMSPEVIEGRPVDERTDLWSLGVVLYEMLSHARPFQADSRHDLMNVISRKQPISLRKQMPSLNENIYRIVEKSLQKNPRNRYQTAAQFREDLEIAKQVLDSKSTEILVRTVREKKWWQIGSLGVLLVIMFAIGTKEYVSRSSPSSPHTTEVRAAVLPFENLTTPDQDGFTQGLTRVLTDFSGEIAERHESMWTAAGRLVSRVKPKTGEEAQSLLGVNSVLSGSLQRFQNGHRITLRFWRDGKTSETQIDFSPDDQKDFVQDLRVATLELLNMDPTLIENFEHLPADETSAYEYLKHCAGASQGDSLALSQVALVLNQEPDFAKGKLIFAEGNIKGHREIPSALRTARETLFELEALGYPTTKSLLGEAALADKDSGSAIGYFLEALAIKPDHSRAASRSSRILRAQNRIDEASTILEEAVRISPDYIGHLRVLANHYFSIGRVTDATIIAGRGLEIAPSDAFCINLLGVIYYNDNDWERAREYFTRSFRLSPNCHNASNVGNMYFYEGRYEESVRFYEFALTYCDPPDHDSWANLATSMYWIDSRRDESLEYFQKAIAIADSALTENPSNTSLRISLADYYALSGQPIEAKRHLDLVEGVNLNDEDDIYRKGCVLEQLGDRTGAIREITKAVRMGLPIPVITGTPELRELREDLRYKELVKERELSEKGVTPTTH